MSHLGLQVAYQGTPFFGFQSQPEKRSVQECLEAALHIVLKKKVRIRFSSRTDRGVHALDQWVMIPEGYSLYLSSKKNNPNLFRYALNAILPDEIRVLHVLELAPNFNPKTDVLWKEYAYQIFNSPVSTPFSNDYWLIHKPLHLKEMKKQLKCLRGTHDFKSFAKTSRRFVMEGRRGSVRTIKKISLEVRPDELIKDAKWLTLKIKADGFLHHMVRNIAGTLVEIGQGKTHQMKSILAQKSRIQAGYRAPPQALTLQYTKIRASQYKLLI